MFTISAVLLVVNSC